MTDGVDRHESNSDDRPGMSIRWRSVLRDLILVAVWVLLVTFALDVLRWPSWAYYVVVFGGIFLFSLVGDPWTTTES